MGPFGGKRAYDFYVEEVYIMKEHPEVYEYDSGGESFKFSYYTACFRGENEKTNMEIYLGLPKRYFEFKEDVDGIFADITNGLFFFDEDMEDVKREVSTEKIFTYAPPDTSVIVQLSLSGAWMVLICKAVLVLRVFKASKTR